MHNCTITISHPMDWILERTMRKGLAGATFGGKVFSVLDYADDVALLAEMLKVFILSLHVMQEEARPFGLEINWSKTKIQTTVQQVQVDGNVVDMVDSFTILEAWLTEMDGAKQSWYDG